jgi:membrane protease YdiL (CAAX protease family)
VPDVDSSLPGSPAEIVAAAPPARTEPRHLPAWVALLEVILVCGIPTQLVVFVPLAYFSGVPIIEGKQLSIELFALTSLIDTALVAILIRVFLGISNETSNDVFLGRRPPLREGLLGLAALPLVYLVVTAIAAALRLVAPWLHTVDENPFAVYMRSPVEAVIFGVVVVLAGGVREELARAFILHRFEQRLGGITVGLAIYTILFGALHLAEGADAAIAVTCLGLFWGLAYIKRRSVLVPMVNHAAFDLLQVVLAFLSRGVSGS